MAAHPHSAPDACSVLAEQAGAGAWGTAARAAFWVALVQPGPWGRDAATTSHLDPDTGAALAEACAAAGGRLSLLRAPGPHPDDHHGHGHAAYLAWSGADPWLLSVRVDDPVALLGALDALAAGDRGGVLAVLPAAVASDPVLLVCTNGRRDVCCAVRGRPVALAAAASHPGRVWEASHTGGHRFAPTGVLLPHGATLARLDAALAAAVLDAAGAGELPAAVLGPVHDRGRSPLEAGAQAAESLVRHRHGVGSLTALSTSGGDGRYAVQHTDGRRWEVLCERVEQAARPESCGKSAVPAMEWRAELA